LISGQYNQKIDETVWLAFSNFSYTLESAQLQESRQLDFWSIQPTD
jgi:hypothetical protein